jgi:hypothetical protein
VPNIRGDAALPPADGAPKTKRRIAPYRKSISLNTRTCTALITSGGTPSIRKHAVGTVKNIQKKQPHTAYSNTPWIQERSSALIFAHFAVLYALLTGIIRTTIIHYE